MHRLSTFCGLGILGLALIVGVSASQDAKKDKDAKEKKEGKTKGMLPQGFKELGLSAEQISKIYAVQSDFNTKVAELTKQINELKGKRFQEEFKVLTQEQRDKYLKNKGLDAKDKKTDDKK